MVKITEEEMTARESGIYTVNVTENTGEEKESKLVRELSELITGIKTSNTQRYTENHNSNRLRENNYRNRNNRSGSRDINRVHSTHTGNQEELSCEWDLVIGLVNG